MAKKSIDLKGGLNALLGNESQQPNKPTSYSTVFPHEQAAQYGRLCAVVNLTKTDKLRRIASLEGMTFKAVLEEAMDLAIDAYEKTHGPIETVPKSKRLFK